MAINKKSDSVVEVNREGLGFTLTSANQNAYPVVYTDDVWTIVANNTEISKVVGLLSGCGVLGTYTTKDVLEAIATVLVETRADLDTALNGAETVSEIVNAALAKLNATKSSTSNGITISVTQENGLITSVSISAPNFSNQFDEKGAAAAVLGKETDTTANKTVYGAFAAAAKAYNDAVNKINSLNASVTSEDDGVSVTVTQQEGLIVGVTVDSKLIGDPTDGPEKNTIYGAKAAAAAVLGKPTDTADNKTVYGAFAAIKGVEDEIDSMKAISEEKIRSLFCK